MCELDKQYLQRYEISEHINKDTLEHFKLKDKTLLSIIQYCKNDKDREHYTNVLNARNSKRMLDLTYWLIALTVFLIGFTIIQNMEQLINAYYYFKR